MTDKELMQKVHNGDKGALGIVIDQYYADIYRFCLYMIQEENDAYDLTQEVFLKFIKYGISYQHNNLKGYLLMIAPCQLRVEMFVSITLETGRRHFNYVNWKK